jgi:hypothetical protein
VFISSSLLTFGGFDGAFYNDLHILHTNKTLKENITVSRSSMHQDFAEVVNVPELSDIEFLLQTSNPLEGFTNSAVVYANKSLVLYRLIERELRTTDFNSGNNIFNRLIPELLSSKAPKTQQLIRDQMKF